MKKYIIVITLLFSCVQFTYSQSPTDEEPRQQPMRAIGLKSYFLTFPYRSRGADYTILYSHQVNEHTFELGPVWVENRNNMAPGRSMGWERPSHLHRLGLNFNYLFYPNGRENTFNLFLVSSLLSVYYEQDFFGFNSAFIGRRTANNYENNLLLGFGMDVPFLQHFNFNIAYSFAGTYRHR